MCQGYRELISRYLDDELSERSRAGLLTHVEECATCAAVLARYRQMDLLMRRGLSDGPRPSAELRARTLAALPKRRGGFFAVGRTLWPDWRLARWAAPAAATLVVALGVGAVAFSTSAPSPDTSTPTATNVASAPQPAPAAPAPAPAQVAPEPPAIAVVAPTNNEHAVKLFGSMTLPQGAKWKVQSIPAGPGRIASGVAVEIAKPDGTVLEIRRGVGDLSSLGDLNSVPCFEPGKAVPNAVFMIGGNPWAYSAEKCDGFVALHHFVREQEDGSSLLVRSNWPFAEVVELTQGLH